MSPSRPLDTQAGAAVYSPLVLRAYDTWVLGASNRWAWQCPTKSVLLPFYRQHLGQRHLDVGVGTGYYLQHAIDTQSVALIDLNEISLRTAARRLGRPNVGLYARDVMKPISLDGAPPFDSISLFYLLHCLPGTMAEKADVFGNLKPHLAASGVLYGATILGDSARHNAFGRLLMRVYNRKGIFGNQHDTLDSLSDALGRHFQTIDIRVHGKVALFSAKQAR